MAEDVLDGGTIEVVNSYLISAAQQMRRTLIRTAFNPVIYAVLDFGISIYDSKIRLMAEAPGITSFVGANDAALPKVLNYVGVENLKEGDVVLLNYPYWNSAHAYDAMLFAPVFHESSDSPSAFVAVRAHWMDLGAKDAGYVLDSTDMHQEVLIFPGTKIVKGGVIDNEIIELIRFNSRLPDLTIGDFHAQLACLRVGERQLHAIWEKFGLPKVERVVEELIDHGKRVAWRAVRSLPHGSWSAEDWLDDDGVTEDPILMRVTVTIDDDGMLVDYTGSSSAVPGPVNLPFGSTESMAKTAFKTLTTPTLSTNAGHYAPLRVYAPPGSLFHAQYPSATFTQWTTMAAFELIYKALASVMPETPASSGSDEPGFMALGRDPRTTKDYVVSNNEGIGWGGTPHHDGASGQMHISLNIVQNTPIEVLENKAALFHIGLRLLPDSAGAGTHRGGLGIERHVQFTADGEVLSMKKKTQTKPWALNGGLEPITNSMTVWPNTDHPKQMRMRRAPMKLGDEFINVSAGGGGWGDPLKRDPLKIVEDVLNGFVQRGTASEIYGVDVDMDGSFTVNVRRRPESPERSG